jgi:hypothetical protein
MRLQIDLTVKPVSDDGRAERGAFEAVATEYPARAGRRIAIMGGSSPEIAASRAVRRLVTKVRKGQD